MKRIAIIIILLMAGTAQAALDAATVFEVRTTGSQNNGGGFADLDPGTSVDYSQQDANQLALTDCNHPAGSTTLTSATGGFTAAMVGNCLRVVSGTNFTVGWYQITAYTSSNQVTVDRSLGASACVTADGVVNIGGAWLLGGALDDDFHEAVPDTALVYIKAGTYTAGENINIANAGTSTGYTTFEGYNATRGDNPSGTDRPLIQTTTSISYNTYTAIKNLQFTGSSATLAPVALAAWDIAFNCKFTYTGTSTIDYALQNTSASSSVIGCEIISGAGWGVGLGSGGLVDSCYIHDCAVGFYNASGIGTISNCIVESCPYGVYLGSGATNITNNTIRGCFNGIFFGASDNSVVINNIISDCYVGAVGTADVQWLDYNLWYNNDTDVTSLTKGDNAVATDPGLASGIVEGTDGVTDGGGTVFTAASNPFSGVDTGDTLVIVEAGTGATVGVYTIASVDGVGQITLSSSAGASKTGIDYRVNKGEDFTKTSSGGGNGNGLGPAKWTDATDNDPDIGGTPNTAAASGGGVNKSGNKQ